MSAASSVIGSLGNLGIEAYQIASGAPVSTSSVGGITTVQTGTAITQSTSIIVIVGIAVVALILWLFLK